MFDYYLNQTATLERAKGENARGEATFDLPTTVKCRKEASGKIVQRASGVDVIISNVYTTNVATFPGDQIDGHRVVVVDSPSLLNGQIPLYWSYVE